MADPIRLDALLAEQFDTVEVPLELTDPVEEDHTEPIDAGDFAPEPEFADFVVWCPFLEDWAKLLRNSPDDPWRCYICDAPDHPRRDHEGDGA